MCTRDTYRQYWYLKLGGKYGKFMLDFLHVTASFRIVCAMCELLYPMSFCLYCCGV